MRAATFLILFVLLPLCPTVGAVQSPAKPLPEGTILQGIDGTLLHDANDTWLFELNADVNRPGGSVAAGTRLRLLPGAMLERSIADVNERFTPSYRLWALVTEYNGCNWLLPTYDLLPLSKRKDEQRPGVQEPNAQGGEMFRPPDSNDPELAIPPEIMAKLRDRRAAQRTEDKGRKAEGGSTPQSLGRMVVDEIGRISVGADGPIFTPDAFGWNASAVHYRLLPCKTLEQAQQRQAASPEPLRFNVAGIVTEFNGNKYLLLQRAIRVYNYGNFGR